MRNKRLCSDKSDRLQTCMQSLQFFDDNIDDYIYILDLSSNRVYFTDKIREKFPLPKMGNKGNDVSDWNNMVYKKDLQYVEYYRKLLVEGKINSFDIVYRLVDKEKNTVWVNVKGTIRKDKHEQSSLLVGRVSEMTLGNVIDSVTGLRNIEKFMLDLKEYLKIKEGYLMILGIDNFKSINLTQGREYGDKVLRKLAEVLEKYSNYPISLYRISGDCFAVVFPGKQQNDVVQFYDSVKKEMKNICTFSGGIVSYKSTDLIDSGIIYQYAENALDQAKKEGKDRVVFFSADNYKKNLEQVELINEMKKCISNNCKGFVLLYQPQIDSSEFEIYGAEALVRFVSPSRGMVSPVEFIPLMEKNGMICEVGEWILKTAVYQCKEWRKIWPDFHISVNISYIQLQQKGITDFVLNLLKEAQVPGEALTLEITESIQLQDYNYFNKIFYAWKQCGIKIAIDDFGTGYSSLSYLKSIEVDEIKIDRCFVDHVQYNAYNYRLLKNMIELAHSENITVCCEGVETIEELMAIKELHADIQQGYLFAKPYTKEELEQVYFCAESQQYQDRKIQVQNFCQMESEENKKLLEELRKEEIGNIVENMEEMVYVSDLDTYELYYLNGVGRQMTGIYDYKGRKCYNVLQGRNDVCEFCSNKHLHNKKFYVWEKENKFLKRHYLLKDKLIPWQGKIARLEIAIDITEKEIVSRSIQKKVDFEKAIVNISNVIANTSNREQAMYEIMKIVGEFCRSDRAYILSPDQQSGLCNISWEWCAQGVDSAREFFPADLEVVMKNSKDCIITESVKQNNNIVGYMCVDNPRCEEDEREFIKTISHLLRSSIFEKKS